MAWPDGDDAPHPRVLVICTANICRSPVAAQILRDRAREMGATVSVASAGFLEDGRSADPTMVAMAAGRGIDVVDHHSRVVSEELVRAADLVVTMERRHARELVVMAPDVAHRVHTLLGLLQAVPFSTVSGPIDEWLREVAARREAADLMGDRGTDHVPDPYSRSKRHYRACLDTLEPAITDLASVLAAFDR